MSGISLDTTAKRKSYVKDFCVATPEEFVKSFGGNIVINKVQKNTFYNYLLYQPFLVEG